MTLMNLGLFLEKAAKYKGDIREYLARWGNLNAVQNYRDSIDLERKKYNERKTIFEGLKNNTNSNIVIKRYWFYNK